MPNYSTKTTTHPGSSKEEISRENDSGSRHRFGSRNEEGRRAGFAGWNDYDREHDIDEVYEGREDWKELEDRRDKANDPLTIRDVMAEQKDFNFVHPSLHVASRFVLNVTEDEIKNDRRWPIVQKKKAEEEEERQRTKGEEKDGQSEGAASDSGISTSSEPQDHNDKSKKDSEDQEFLRNRKREGGDERAHRAQPSADNGEQKDGLSSTERHLLHHLQQESEHMVSLQSNDGQGVSPFYEQPYREICVDEADQNSPDNWIPRSKDLMRMTGQHPLNGEPVMEELFGAGLVTPTSLHYVRNHGAVPRLDFETHQVHFSLHDGLEPLAKARLGEWTQDGQHLRMQDIVSLPTINIPVTLACDGNRRKEMNMIRRSKGFDWGPGAVSNVYWKGPLLKDVLEAAGIIPKQRSKADRLFIHFEGADELQEGRYATSIPLEHALDPCNDVLLAHEMNDRPLSPDHGYPIRVIIPGFVGGRCVKWLQKIWISTKPNDSHFHVWDNRVLPEFVTEKDGPFAEAMFRHPDTACMEQNLNSIVVHPRQDEELVVEGDAFAPAKTYRIEGYAYDGGGHMVQKVEVSLDGGKSWLYAFRRFPERALRHGWKFWTWCHWYCDVQIASMLGASEICVRAWNVFKNTQPDDITPNLMGMMNNAIYRVRPRIEQAHGKTILTFDHPVSSNSDRGWMKPSVTDRIKAVEQKASSPSKSFTREEIEKHNSDEDCWIVVNDKVYDATTVLEWHPGGAHAILGVAGKCDYSTSEQYNSIHDDYANHKLQEVCIGSVTDKARQAMKAQQERRAKEASQEDDPTLGLRKHRWTPVTLTDRVELSDSSVKYTFSFPEKRQRLGLPPGKHVLLGFHLRDKMVFRSYTPTRPIMPEEEDGTFDLVIKTYFPSERDAGGTLSNVLDCLKIGEKCDVRGPTGEIAYKGDGVFDVEGTERRFDTVNLVAGGTGVTPHYQLVCRILKSRNDETKINMLYANRSEDGILLREELEELAEKHEQFTLTHVLSKPGKKWQGETGHAGPEQFNKYFAKDDSSACFLCGPPPLVKSAHESLVKMGFEDERSLFAF
ncbi:hypothetical protein PYCC9005_004407 [Savitreella phatthalungensis]